MDKTFIEKDHVRTIWTLRHQADCKGELNGPELGGLGGPEQADWVDRGRGQLIAASASEYLFFLH